MKSIVGFAFALGVVLVFGVAWRLATRDDAGVMDQQWLFLVALPYNFLSLQIFGESDFSAQAAAQVAAAALAEAALAYIAGAMLEAAARGAWRIMTRA